MPNSLARSSLERNNPLNFITSLIRLMPLSFQDFKNIGFFFHQLKCSCCTTNIHPICHQLPLVVWNATHTRSENTYTSRFPLSELDVFILLIFLEVPFYILRLQHRPSLSLSFINSGCPFYSCSRLSVGHQYDFIFALGPELEPGLSVLKAKLL